MGSVMANLVSLKHSLFALALLSIFLSSTRLGKAQNTSPETTAAAAGVLQNEYYPGTGGTGITGGSNEENPEYIPGKGGAGGSEEDPDHIISQALLCFNEKHIYSSCSEAYRLSESGYLHVPPENTEEYCNSPCVSETDHVLSCIESVLLHFKFYNKATVNDVRETIKSGCSYGPQRGDFNVAKHIQGEYNRAEMSWRSSLFLHGMLLLVIHLGCHLWL